MTIKATNVKCKDLKPGDLFSTAEQEYWDEAASGNLQIGAMTLIQLNHTDKAVAELKAEWRKP